MTEFEKITYAKSFIDKMANGINPIDDTPIPEGDLLNNVRISRCLFYVAGILQGEIEREWKCSVRENKPRIRPFSVTQEQLQAFEYSSQPISAAAIARKINFLVREEIGEKQMKRFSQRSIKSWLCEIGMLEWRVWETGAKKLFPTADGEAIGLTVVMWENYGRRSPVVSFSEEAQHFIIDHLEAIISGGTEADDALQDGDEGTEG